MIRVGTDRQPVTVALRGHLTGVTLTLKRLTSADYAEALQAAQAILRNDAKLLMLLVEHDLVPEGKVKAWKRMKSASPDAYAAFLTGVGAWLAAVECGERGIKSWTGIVGDDKAPAPVSREIIEVLMLEEDFQRQVVAQLDKAARILLIEGEP